jgi:hypothetical protein
VPSCWGMQGHAGLPSPPPPPGMSSQRGPRGEGGPKPGDAPLMCVLSCSMPSLSPMTPTPLCNSNAHSIHSIRNAPWGDGVQTLSTALHTQHYTTTWGEYTDARGHQHASSYASMSSSGDSSVAPAVAPPTPAAQTPTLAGPVWAAVAPSSSLSSATPANHRIQVRDRSGRKRPAYMRERSVE